MKTMDETLGKFKNWESHIELHSGKKIKYLRTNNVLEYCNEGFNNFYKECGITRHRVWHTHLSKMD